LTSRFSSAITPMLVNTSTMPGSVAPSPPGVSGSTLSNEATSAATSAPLVDTSTPTAAAVDGQRRAG
jgi:hypothetical protein